MAKKSTSKHDEATEQESVKVSEGTSKSAVGNKWQKIAEENADSAAQEDGEQSPDSAENLVKEFAEEGGSKEELSGLDFPSRSELENQLTAMEMQVDKHKQEALRFQAELDNVRRRAERDISNAHKYGIDKLVVELLPVADSLIRALQSTSAEGEASKAMREGMQLTLDLLHKTLAKFGVEMIGPNKGDVFNPELHEAMSMLEDPSAKPNTIIQVLQQGYQLNGRVLRAAMVMVAKG